MKNLKQRIKETLTNVFEKSKRRYANCTYDTKESFIWPMKEDVNNLTYKECKYSKPIKNEKSELFHSCTSYERMDYLTGGKCPGCVGYIGVEKYLNKERNEIYGKANFSLQELNKEIQQKCPGYNKSRDELDTHFHLSIDIDSFRRDSFNEKRIELVRKGEILDENSYSSRAALKFMQALIEEHSIKPKKKRK